jgi:hypothetical protein
MPNEEQGSGFSVYLITDQQLHALRAASNPYISGIIAEIEGQGIGAIRGFADAPASEARGILLDRYRNAFAQIEQAGPAFENPPEEINDEETRPRGRSGF